jgi:hypothetical protein
VRARNTLAANSVRNTYRVSRIAHVVRNTYRVSRIAYAIRIGVDPQLTRIPGISARGAGVMGMTRSVLAVEAKSHIPVTRQDAPALDKLVRVQSGKDKPLDLPDHVGTGTGGAHDRAWAVLATTYPLQVTVVDNVLRSPIATLLRDLVSFRPTPIRIACVVRNTYRVPRIAYVVRNGTSRAAAGEGDRDLARRRSPGHGLPSGLRGIPRQKGRRRAFACDRGWGARPSARRSSSGRASARRLPTRHGRLATGAGRGAKVLVDTVAGAAGALRESLRPYRRPANGEPRLRLQVPRRYSLRVLKRVGGE